MLIPLTIRASDVTVAVQMARERVRRDGHAGVAIAAVQQLGGLTRRVVVSANDPPPPVPGAG
jgi:hypothetical protein